MEMALRGLYNGLKGAQGARGEWIDKESGPEIKYDWELDMAYGSDDLSDILVSS